MTFDSVKVLISKRLKTTVPASDRRFSSLTLGVSPVNPSTATEIGSAESVRSMAAAWDNIVKFYLDADGRSSAFFTTIHPILRNP